MEVKQFPITRLLCSLCLVCLLSIGCDSKPAFTPAEVDTSSIQLIGCKRIDHKQDVELSGPIQVDRNGGFPVILEIQYSETLPEEFSDPRMWQCHLVFRRQDAPAADPSYSPCLSMCKVDGPQFVPIIFVRAGPQWRLNERFKQPKPQPCQKNRVIPFWTLIGPPFDETGEFILEVAVYPRFRRIGTTGFDPGDPVVISRGLLQVK